MSRRTPAWITDPEVRARMRTKDFEPPPPPKRAGRPHQSTTSRHMYLPVHEVKVYQIDGTLPPYAVIQESHKLLRDYAGQELTDTEKFWQAGEQIFPQPEGMEFCNECGDWRPRNYFALNPAHKRGVDYFCKQCKNERDRNRYAITVVARDKEVRRYYKPKAA